MLAVGADGGCFGHFLSSITFLSPSLWEGGGRVVRRCWVNFQCWGVLLIWIIVGQGPIVLAEGAGCLDIFSLIYHLFISFSLGGWSGGVKVLGKLPVPGLVGWLVVLGLTAL